MNSDLSSDDNRQDVSTMATPPINSKLDIRWPVPETRQHDKKEMQKKLKVMTIDKVIMTAQTKDERLHPFI